MSFKDTQSYKELQADWRWIHEMDPEAAAAADQWVKEHPEEWKELEHILSESVIRKEEPMPDDLFVMDFAISVPENQDEKKPYLSLKRLDTVYRLEVGHSVSGNARRLYNFFDSFSKQKEQIEDSRKKLRASIKELEAIAAQKNPYPEQIAALRDEVRDLEQGIAKKASD